ncbi:hypothetical protein Pcinc_030413, partial [Petrolisthes cinctipes]
MECISSLTVSSLRDWDTGKGGQVRARAGGSPTCCSAPPQVPSSIRQWRPAPPARPHVAPAALTVRSQGRSPLGRRCRRRRCWCHPPPVPTASPSHTLTNSLSYTRGVICTQPHLAALAARTAHHGTHPAQGGPRPPVAHT